MKRLSSRVILEDWWSYENFSIYEAKNCWVSIIDISPISLDELFFPEISWMRLLKLIQINENKINFN